MVSSIAFSLSQHNINTVFSGGSSKDKESLLDEIKQLYLGGASGSIVGRNSFQRPYTEALELLNQIIEIYKGK